MGSNPINSLRFLMYSFIVFTIYGYITNSQRDQVSVGLTAQLVEHFIGIAKVIGSIHICLSCVCDCNGHSRLRVFLCSSDI